MKRFAFLLCGAATVGCSLLAQSAPAKAENFATRQAIYTVLPARGVNPRLLSAQAAKSKTIPFFQSSVVSGLDGMTYPWEMVGKNPLNNPKPTTVKYVTIVARVHFLDGTVLDPTQPGCNDTDSVLDRFLNSPLFKPTKLTSNGVYVGKVQVTDGFQRANFWQYVAGTNYHVELKPAGQPIVVDVTAPTESFTQSGVCSGSNHNEGEIDLNSWDAIVQQLDAQYALPNQLPIVLTYNVFETEYGAVCCVLGYHSAFSTPNGTQTYAVGAYSDPGFFSQPIEDIDAWTHEIGEWMDDPFVQTDNYNVTPAWGNVGQVTGCQNNLEVGDPLTGTAYTIQYNNFTYHPQELAFFSWFYRIASTGTGGMFSFNGTFTSAQGTCTG